MLIGGGKGTGWKLVPFTMPVGGLKTSMKGGNGNVNLHYHIGCNTGQYTQHIDGSYRGSDGNVQGLYIWEDS